MSRSTRWAFSIYPERFPALAKNARVRGCSTILRKKRAAAIFPWRRWTIFRLFARGSVRRCEISICSVIGHPTQIAMANTAVSKYWWLAGTRWCGFTTAWGITHRSSKLSQGSREFGVFVLDLLGVLAELPLGGFALRDVAADGLKLYRFPPVANKAA